MRPETLLGVLYIVVRVAILAGIVYYALASVRRERKVK
jgi:hypothetical protein